MILDAVKKPGKPIKFPLSRKKRLLIIDRDATVFSSWEVAYACYEEAFDKVISAVYPPSAKLTKEEYTVKYHPFEKNKFYQEYYPKLSEEQLKAVGEASWQFYVSNFAEERFNKLIPGMDDFLKALKSQGNRLVLLTASEGGWEWIRHYDLPFDEVISLVKLREAGELQKEEKKEIVILYIIEKFESTPEDSVTIGDHPLDHVDVIVSIGSGYGLGSPEAREELRGVVDFYASSVRDLHKVFGL